MNNFRQSERLLEDLEGRRETKDPLCHLTHLVSSTVETEGQKESFGSWSWHQSLVISFKGVETKSGQQRCLWAWELSGPSMVDFLVFVFFLIGNSSHALFLRAFQRFSLNSTQYFQIHRAAEYSNTQNSWILTVMELHLLFLF